jgi:hypothetical protein
LVVSGGDGSVDLEMAEHALDAIALSIEALAVGDIDGAVRLRRDDGLDPAPFQVVSDGIGIVGLVGEQGLGCLLGQVDQRFVGLAVRCLAWREMEGDWSASGISETVNLTGEPAPRAAKSASIGPPFPPAAETWARTVVLSML